MADAEASYRGVGFLGGKKTDGKKIKIYPSIFTTSSHNRPAGWVQVLDRGLRCVLVDLIKTAPPWWKFNFFDVFFLQFLKYSIIVLQMIVIAMTVTFEDIIVVILESCDFTWNLPKTAYFAYLGIYLKH